MNKKLATLSVLLASTVGVNASEVSEYCFPVEALKSEVTTKTKTATLMLNSGSFSQIQLNDDETHMATSNGTERCFNIEQKQRILFHFDRSNLLTRFDEILEKLNTSALEAGSIVIEGHADEHGSEQYNYKLALQRAESVKNHLIRNGIDANKIKVISKGSTELLSESSQKDGLSDNRRAEVIVISAIPNE
ncbi:OmpA family protein [Vibrio owensii]|uniref:OmpA family protein n=1 Tax=Vibrio owensii TaxID=696485 RepID=UPI000690F651|nr:OmpA family protein [Vibrio owensii]